ncbi:hypothetical protein ACS0TY_008298 [Phlomoides rotata]
MKHTVDLYNHSRRITEVTTRVHGMMRYRTFRVSLSERAQYVVDPTRFVPECYSTNEHILTYSSGFFAPLPNVEEWDESNFQPRPNPDHRIRRRGLDVTSRIHNEMDWAQTRGRQQYQAQDGAGPSAQGSASHH